MHHRPDLSARDAPIAVIYRPIEQLKPDPRNARRHEPKQIRQIADSIQAFGFNVPILVDADLKVIAGHGRLPACRRGHHDPGAAGESPTATQNAASDLPIRLLLTETSLEMNVSRDPPKSVGNCPFDSAPIVGDQEVGPQPAEHAGVGERGAHHSSTTIGRRQQRRIHA